MLKKNENKGQVVETQTAEISLQKKPRPVLKKTKKLLQSSMLAFSIATAALPQVSCTVDQLEAFLATTAVFSLVLAASSVDVSVSWDSHCHPSTPDYPYDSQYFYSSKIQEAVDSMSYREKKYFEAFKVSELCNSLADSVTTVEDKAKLFEYEKKYDKSRLENENLRIKNERTWLYLLLTIGVILLLVAYLVIHKRTQQTKKSLSIISQLQEEAIAVKQDIVLQKISEIKIKKAMESQFDNIRKLIDLSYSYEGKPTLFVKAFRQQIKTSKSELSSNLMKDIRLFVDLNYNNFISIISDKYPFLKDDELMIISLLRCGFSYVEISICMGYDNFDYVNTKKLRIAKKMGLATSLKKFIDDYSYD